METTIPKKTRKPKEALLGNNIKEELERQGMSQQEFADLLHVDPGFASRIINKEKCISLPIALNVAQILKKSVEELFYKKKIVA